METGAFKIRRLAAFDRWLERLNDKNARGRIAARIARLEDGSWGDVRSVGRDVFELRVDCGPGYRVYGTIRGAVVVLLLCGGDKGSQKRDIARAQRMADRLKTGAYDEESL